MSIVRVSQRRFYCDTHCDKRPRPPATGRRFLRMGLSCEGEFVVKLNRKLNRLKNYDYSRTGNYFVTICTKNRQNCFGEILDGKMNINDYGKLAETFWLKISEIYPNVQIGEFVIMPNHIHGIIAIVGTEQCSVPTQCGLLSKIIKSYKDIFTKTIRQQYGDIQFGWQRSYYDHVIRNEESFDKIRAYIQRNPSEWKFDRNCIANL